MKAEVCFDTLRQTFLPPAGNYSTQTPHNWIPSLCSLTGKYKLLASELTQPFLNQQLNWERKNFAKDLHERNFVGDVIIPRRLFLTWEMWRLACTFKKWILFQSTKRHHSWTYSMAVWDGRSFFSHYWYFSWSSGRREVRRRRRRRNFIMVNNNSLTQGKTQQYTVK